MRILRNFVFLIFFSLDVTVRASGGVHSLSQKTEPSIGLARLKAPVEEPKHCFAKAAICALGTYPDSKYILDLGPTHLFLGSDTNVTRMQRDQYVLLKGEVWVKTEDEVVFDSEFGSVSVDHGNALVAKRNKHLIVRNLNARVEFRPKGAESFNLERGFENALGAVDKSGHASVGIPQLVDIAGSLKLLGQLFTGEKLEFKMLAEELFHDWSVVVENASHLHEALALRAVASDQESLEAARRRRQAFEAERQRLRKLYREKTLEY